ncbi:acyltransferase [Alteromonas lipolytica]|uniref:Acyltransferase n=1 Tax=Alteromonas lipolytica TaxID=1856405 RepID=A0A1E8FC90_9ALTE|nr:acyltransferase [Alteromonas lipolytica]OFI33530.1 acyltransferase [Alteromonas lipolytica]GGF58881.1 acyltransferase [Alteromonas lipolytica]
MLRVVLAPLIFIVHLPLQVANLALWGGLVILFGLVRILLPVPAIQRMLAPLMNTFMFCFGKVSLALIRLFNPVILDYRVKGNLSKDSWYLIVANHLSYLDIILLIEFAAFRIPAPKFFLKQELIWLPFVGLAAWALEMPFMRRYSAAYLQKFPHKRGTDIITTKRYCEKFRHHPTTVINFVEGTRYTPAKHASKNSPYQSLLPPKAGGIAFTLATMGELFTNILDVSLLYPDNEKHPMFAALSGQMRRIIVDVNVIDIPQEAIGDYYNDAEFRTGFQYWVNSLWQTKDFNIIGLKKGN